MAVGDDASAAGYLLVPSDGEEGKVKYGARELNRTRDYVAQLKNQLPSGRAAYRLATGISYGTASPAGGSDGDIYFRVITS